MRLRKDDAYGIKLGPCLRGGDEEGKIGFVSHIFFDVVENKTFLTPEKRFRNDFSGP